MICKDHVIRHRLTGIQWNLGTRLLTPPSEVHMLAYWTDPMLGRSDP